MHYFPLLAYANLTQFVLTHSCHLLAAYGNFYHVTLAAFLQPCSMLREQYEENIVIHMFCDFYEDI